MMDARQEVTVIRMEPFWQPTDNCCMCDAEVVIWTWQENYGIPLYEGTPVPPEWDGEWGGFCACKECFDKYERGEFRMWTVAELEHTTRRAASQGQEGGTNGR